MKDWTQQYRPEKEQRQTVGALMTVNAKPNPDVDAFFGEGGALSRAFPGNYRPRGGQINLAQMVGHALRLRRTLVAEAETGTGKSFALLVPAIFLAVREGRTVVISTATLALQDQYCNKDLPMLQKAFAEIGIEFKFRKAQGRSNYYCLDSKGTNDFEFAYEIDTLQDWLLTTQTGDFNELPFDIKSPKLGKFWEANRADSEDCPGQKHCAFGGQCWFYKAKEAASFAQVIVVNHALLALNDRLERFILPPYHALLVDECHQLERYVRSAWEAQLSARRFYRLGQKLAKIGVDGQELLDATGKRLAEFLEEYLSGFRSSGTGQVDFLPARWPSDWAGWVDSQAEPARDLVEMLCAICEEIPKAAPIAGSVKEAYKDLTRVLDPQGGAKWIEHDRKGTPLLKISPVDVSEQCRRLYDVPTVLTSATLAIGTSYDFAKVEMGCENPIEMPPLHSPFDWKRNCLYVFPKPGTLVEADLKAARGEAPRQTARRWATRISGTIKGLLQATEGRAFVLFTSKAVMEEAYELVAPHCRQAGWDVLIQGELSKGETVARFKAGRNPVLFATSSFWEGVDVPGSQLSLVIIDKLPFPSPSSPVEKAKSDQLGFAGYNVPMVVRTLKQGVGRLIRSETDRGVVCILDPRVHKYRNQIMRHLPGDPLAALDRTGPLEISKFLSGSPLRLAQSPLEEWAARGLRKLAALDPDGASEQNDVGFNGADTDFGRSLAGQLDRGLSDKQWSLAANLLRKYWRQIGRPPEPTVDELMANYEEETEAA